MHARTHAPRRRSGPAGALAGLLIALAAFAPSPTLAQGVTSAFTYQGELRTGAGAATGSFDMEYRLFDSLAGSSQVGPTVARNGVAVANGLFSVALDFGPAQFAGERQWLEVRIRPAGGGAFETLAPRTEVTAAPYALGAVAALANSVTTTSIVDGAIGAADLNASQVQRRVTGFCPPGQYVRVVAQDGTVTCEADSGGLGTVTSVGTGAGLAGGPITSSGSIAVATNGISSSMIADGNVTAADILDTQVQRRVVGSCPAGQYVRLVNQDGTVVCGTDAGGGGGSGTVTTVNTGAGLTGGPITTTGTVAIATGGVTSALIADGTIATGDIAPGAIDSGAIANGSVLAADVDAGQVQRRVVGACALGDFLRLVNQDGTVVCGSDTQGSGTVTSVGSGAGLSGGPITSSGTLGIATGGVIAPMIAVGAVGSLQLATAAVESSKIADGSVTVAKINPSQVQVRVTGNCVTGQYIRSVNENGTVLCGTDSGTGTVTSVATGTGLTGGPVTGSGTISVAAGGIGSTEINAAQVQRRVTGTCSGGNFVQQVNQDGTVGCTPAPSANAWSLGGNAATNPVTQFIGTTDAQPLVIRTRNVRSVLIEPSAALDVSSNPLTANVAMGSYANLASPGVRGAAIGGGGVPGGANDPDFGATGDRNIVHDHYGTVGGGWDNLAGNSATGIALEPFATVGGGRENGAFAANSTVAGGFGNAASGVGTAIGGGEANIALGLTSVVGGGNANMASGGNSTVAGGTSNTAGGTASAVGGGSTNCAGGSHSWAGGRRAKARPGFPGNSPGTGCTGVADSGDADGDDGSFVWADGQNSDFVSSGPNQFLVRATGGMVVSGGAVNDPAGNRLRVAGGTLRIDQLGAAGTTSLCRNADNQIASCSSSARYKTDIDDFSLGLDAAQHLRPVSFRWKSDGSPDVGFVAEEVAALEERLVTRNASGAIEGVRYDRLTTVLVNAVQELAARESLAREAYERLAADNAALAAGQRRLAAELAALRAAGAERRGGR